MARVLTRFVPVNSRNPPLEKRLGKLAHFRDASCLCEFWRAVGQLVVFAHVPQIVNWALIHCALQSSGGLIRVLGLVASVRASIEVLLKDVCLSFPCTVRESPDFLRLVLIRSDQTKWPASS